MPMANHTTPETGRGRLALNRALRPWMRDQLVSTAFSPRGAVEGIVSRIERCTSFDQRRPFQSGRMPPLRPLNLGDRHRPIRGTNRLTVTYETEEPLILGLSENGVGGRLAHPTQRRVIDEKAASCAHH
jgi:hypothetical protein